jgi:metal-responsive CopG/Arc/MetJ family transcriptional regulator
MPSAKPNQLNIRVDRKLEVALDEKRIEFSKQLGYIPSRSEVVRRAIEQFLNINRPGGDQPVADEVGKTEVATSKVTKRKG